MKDATPLVSVIIPCYNGEGFVADAIDSALAQTYRNVEVIVIDDGSTDNSLGVIESFGDRVRRESGPNRGGSRARNRGLELAQGEVIQFLDADDLLDPLKIESQLGVLVGNPDAFVTCGWRTTELASGRLISDNAVPSSIESPIRYTLQTQIQTATVLHHRENLLAIAGFDERLPCSQERDLHLRLVCSGLRVLAACDELVTVRRRPGSVSSGIVRILDQHEAIFSRALDLTEKSGLMTDALRRAFARAFASDARAYVTQNEIGKARHYFEMASALDSRGIEDAFEGRSRMLLKLLGPVTAQRLVRAKRGLG